MFGHYDKKYKRVSVNVIKTDNLLCKHITDTCSISNTSNCDRIHVITQNLLVSLHTLFYYHLKPPPPFPNFPELIGLVQYFTASKIVGLGKPLHNETERLIKDKMYLVLDELSQPQNKKNVVNCSL